MGRCFCPRHPWETFWRSPTISSTNSKLFFFLFLLFVATIKKNWIKKRGGDLSNWKKRGGKNIRKDVNGRRWDIKKMMAPSYNTHRPATHKWKFAQPFFDIIRFVCYIKKWRHTFFPGGNKNDTQIWINFINEKMEINLNSYTHTRCACVCVI
jgi:hypothetical protein